ncbi:MAG: tetratricopeptide repeat protein [Candidatus Abyssobacteria bacterium SURF_17]|uniref:Tetratricopeptide repeat protein n=1 Tax=Candidatus Abyssobacteria bacterium SURF_17 TaxID=2093361 RepID=A0A419EZF5_9BACT|nr:MAG: tetratricopeptide repeat protein [Candidatus Abyssubacteria bacterium SURF_17]
MGKFGYLLGAVSLIAICGCGSLSSVKTPQLSSVNILKSSENQRVYHADYDTTFRTAVDVLRQIDDTSAKLVKYGSGLIVFQKPDATGTITAHIKKVDETNTQVELSAENKRKYWIDSADVQTRDAFFTEMDKRMAATPAEPPKRAADNSAQVVPTETSNAPGESEGKDKSILLAKLRQKLQPEDNALFLDQLSYDDLAFLDRRLQEIEATDAERKNLAGRCAACYIDLGRVYHDSGQYARAAEALKEALAVDPENAVAHCNLGEIYKHLHLYDDALRELKLAERLNPNLPDTYINMGIIYDDYVVDDQKALQYYRKYLELGGTDKQVLEWISVLEKDS